MKVIYNIHIEKNCIRLFKNGGMEMDKNVQNNYVKVSVCKRCEEDKKVNRFGLCKTCNSEVDREYAMLYGFKTMDY